MTAFSVISRCCCQCHWWVATVYCHNCSLVSVLYACLNDTILNDIAPICHGRINCGAVLSLELDLGTNFCSVRISVLTHSVDLDKYLQRSASADT